MAISPELLLSNKHRPITLIREPTEIRNTRVAVIRNSVYVESHDLAATKSSFQIQPTQIQI